jgi:hypothetical protein
VVDKDAFEIDIDVLLRVGVDAVDVIHFYVH